MKNTAEIIAFNKLYADYYELFLRFACTYIKNKAAADDIVIESIVYYWENRQNLKSDSNIPAYILEVIKHKCLNYLRHIRVRENYDQQLMEHELHVNNQKIATLEALNPQELFSKEVQELIDKTLAKMPDKTRQLFMASRYENKTYPEIAKYYSVSEKSVEYHISKALQMLRSKLKDYVEMILFF